MPPAGVERLERADRLGELHLFQLAERVHLGGLATTQYPRRGGVVVERALERVDDLVVERRLRFLGQPADVDPDLLRLVEPPNALGCEDVHHSRGQPAIGNHRDPRRDRLFLELLLLEHDLGVAAEIREVAPGLDRGPGHGAVIVVGDGAHHRRVALKRFPHRVRVGDVELHHAQPAPPVSREKRGKVVRPQIGQRHLRNSGILQ